MHLDNKISLLPLVLALAGPVAALEVPRGGMRVRSLQDYAADRVSRLAAARLAAVAAG